MRCAHHARSRCALHTCAHGAAPPPANYPTHTCVCASLPAVVTSTVQYDSIKLFNASDQAEVTDIRQGQVQASGRAVEMTAEVERLTAELKQARQELHSMKVSILFCTHIGPSRATQHG